MPDPSPVRIDLPDEAATARLAARVGDALRAGDVVCLRGTLGAGKSAFARALIRHLGDPEQEVPSPTFTLVQTYPLPDFEIWHFDLYRLSDPAEVEELGWDEVRADGVALVEWPDRLGGLLPKDRLDIEITIADGDARIATLSARGAWGARLPALAPASDPAPDPAPKPVDRDARIRDFLTAAGWGAARRLALGADWSSRRYERLTQADGATALLMDAEGDAAAQVAPFQAIGARLRGLGLRAPAVLAALPGEGLALVEDFGDTTYAALLDASAPGADAVPWRPLYERATDVLVALHQRFQPGPDDAALPRYDAALFTRQAGLFAAYYLPHRLGRPLSAGEEAAIDAAWAAALSAVLGDAAQPPDSLLLRDYHPGNLMHLGGPFESGAGIAACGLIDFQDAGLGHRAYDLISLLQDARRDVPADLAAAMTARYLAAFPEVDAAAFARAAAVLAAQRHARILGRVAQILAADPQAPQASFLRRVEGQFARALAHPALAPLVGALHGLGLAPVVLAGADTPTLGAEPPAVE